MQEVTNEVVNNYDTIKYIGVGLCSLGMAGAALAIGNIFGSFFNSIARNPSAAPKMEKYIYIAAGLAEALGIFAVLVAFLILFG
ncbi:MAG: F0F1 ATP synthase subunit C [Rickettsiales bacterium]|jgi:F-type H+-transporting ATPase subunit c|nr:F0F1 ATP synthase subunit C [Rickettsiales bacterium]|tara:strand:+ start:540 stop:791 length:252 start_codon:yes stop_codon:yes gene_type:complete